MRETKNMTSKLLVVLIAVIALMGCTSMRPVDVQQLDLAAELEADDRLLVYESSGRIIDMTFIALDDGTIRGRMNDGSQGPISVAVTDIEKLEVEKIDGAKTTLAVVGGTIVIVPIAVIAGTLVLLGGG